MSNMYKFGCAACHKPLQSEDDVVVCPECGAAYHRSCYLSAGECLFQDRHGTGFVYGEPAPKEQAERYVLCPNCQKANPADAPACGNCGTPLCSPEPSDAGEADTEQPGQSSLFSDSEAVPAYRRKKAEVSPDIGKFRPVDDAHLRLNRVEDTDGDANPMNELKKQLNLEETLDGFTLKEWLCFIGPAGPLYLFQFKKMDASRRGFAFSLPAAFFPGIYFLYRKIWGWGILALLVKLLCSAPALLGFACANGALPGFPFTAAQLSLFSRYATYLDTAMSIFWGIAAATLYRRHGVHRLHRLKCAFEGANASGTPLAEDFYLFLARKGGVCLPAGLAAGVLSALASYLVLWLL